MNPFLQMLMRVQALEPGSPEDIEMKLNQGLNNPVDPYRIWPELSPRIGEQPRPMRPNNDNGAWPPLRNVLDMPKFNQKLGPEGTPGGLDKGGMQALIDGPLDANAYLRSDAMNRWDFAQGELVAPPKFTNRSEGAQEWSSWDTQMFPAKPHTWLGMEALAPMVRQDQSPVSNAEYLQLIRRMVEAARPL
jgi:hypothetical protein